VTYMLDTSIYSQPLKKHPVPTVIERWKKVGDLSCCVSVFCEMEVLQGLYIAGSKRLSGLYLSALKGRIPILPFNVDEARIFSRLQADFTKTGTIRPVIDLCIAATALNHNCVLVTLNVKDFDGIPGLSIETW